MPLDYYARKEGIYPIEQHFSEECLTHYQQEGWVLLKNFYDFNNDLLPIHCNVNQLITNKLAELGIPFLKGDGGCISNQNFLAICEQNREKAGEIYRATRHLCATHKLLVKEQNLQLAQKLMQTESVNIIPYVPLRIDIKGEEKYLFEWHQDYPYTQGSTDGIVVWAPLFDVKDGEGGIKFIPGSHKKGILPVVVADKGNANGNGAQSIRLPDIELFEKQQAYTVDVKAGDALVFSTLLLHKSLPLRQTQIRWTTQLRYANFDESDAVARGWPGGMIEGNWFEKDHPEYIVEDNKG